MSSVNVTIRIDKELKQEADEALSQMGLSLSNLVVMTLKQLLREGKLPFTPTIERPNAELQQAIEETIQGKNLSKSFTSVNALMEDVLP